MKKTTALKRAFKYIGKYKYLVPVSILMALVSTALSLIVPILIGDAIDLAVGRGLVDLAGIVKILTTSALLIAGSALCSWLMSVINNRIAFYISRDIRNEAFSKIEKLPLSYIDSHPHGDTVNRIINDTDRFSEGLLLGFTQIFTGVLTIVGTMVFMVIVNWQVALCVLLLTPLSIFIAKYIGGKTYKLHKARSESEARAAGFIDEVVANHKLVRAFGKESDELARFKDISEELEGASLSAIFLSSLTNPTTRFVNNMVYAAVALSGALLIVGEVSAAFTIGQFSVLLSYTNQYTKPFNEISGVFAEFQGALASSARVFDLIEEKSEPEDAPDAHTLGYAEGTVEMRDVSFSYDEDRPLIENLNLKVSPGQRIAIVGPTGCGKTTLINLLMRFYDTVEGKIIVDGKEIKDIARRSLRTSYGMVLQDTWLTGGTVKENIAFGKPDATDEEIILAAKSAHAHSFIKRLPLGYDTVLGEGGEGLSQGQKQLISIARIMLTSPPMLILDEATSSIDTRTEMRIQRAFAEMMVGKTSFIVAHRLSTIAEADLILVMRDGNIVESGRHEELLNKGGFYKELYDAQFAH